MLRPELFIGVYSVDFADELVSGSFDNTPSGDIYKYQIRTNTWSTQENRDGLSLTINTKSNKYLIEVGDKMRVDARYRGINTSFTTLPTMIVTSVNLNSENTLEILAVDEFQYHCQSTNYIPTVPKESQIPFIEGKLGIVAQESNRLIINQQLEVVQTQAKVANETTTKTERKTETEKLKQEQAKLDQIYTDLGIVQD